MSLYPGTCVTVGPIRLKRYERIETRYKYDGVTTTIPTWSASLPSDGVAVTDKTGSGDSTFVGQVADPVPYVYSPDGGTTKHAYSIFRNYTVIYDYKDILTAAVAAGYTKAAGYNFIGFQICNSSGTPQSLGNTTESINVLSKAGAESDDTVRSSLPVGDVLTNHLSSQEQKEEATKLQLDRNFRDAWLGNSQPNFQLYQTNLDDSSYWSDMYAIAYFMFGEPPADYQHNYEVNKPEGSGETKDPNANQATSSGSTGPTGPTGPKAITYGVSRYTYPNLYTDEGSFDYLYIPSNIWPTVQLSNGVVVGANGANLVDVSIDSIKNSLTDADEMEFTEHIKYDENGTFNEGSKVFGLIKGTTRFIGYVTSKRRVINSGEQYIKYTALGLRYWLNNLPFAQVYNVKDTSIKTIFEKIVKSIPSFIVADYDVSALADKMIPDFYTVAANIGPTLEQAIDKAGHYGYYIDHTKKLTVYDLSNLVSYIDLAMAKEGWYLKDHPECKILSKDLSIDLSMCKTRAIILGDYRVVVKRVVATAELIPDTVYYKIQLGQRILNQIPGREENVIIEPLEGSIFGTQIINPYYPQNTVHSLIPSYVRLSDGMIKGVQPLYSTTPDSFQVYVTFAAVENPVVYDTGWQGTAFTTYNVQNVIQKYDTKFKYIQGSDGYDRDDTLAMKVYAESLIAPYKDFAMGGTITLDGLVTDLAIGKAIRLTNTQQATWATTKLVIRSVTFDIANLTTQVEVTSNYYLGTGLVDPRIEDKQEKLDETELFHRLLQRMGEQEMK